MVAETAREPGQGPLATVNRVLVVVARDCEAMAEDGRQVLRQGALGPVAPKCCSLGVTEPLKTGLARSSDVLEFI